MYILRAHACFYFAFYAWRMALRREDLGRWYNTVDFAKQWTVRVVLALACFFLNIVWRIPMRAVVGESMIFCALRYTYYAHVKFRRLQSCCSCTAGTRVLVGPPTAGCSPTRPSLIADKIKFPKTPASPNLFCSTSTSKPTQQPSTPDTNPPNLQLPSREGPAANMRGKRSKQYRKLMEQ